MDLYLKFKDKAEADSVIYVDAKAEELQFVYQNTDVVGTIYKPTGIMLKEKDGMEYPEMKALDGYHVNVRLCNNEDGKALTAYIVEPTSPVRIWG
jgi:hypothetical protein